jgi:hypothetical protein
VDYSDVSTFFIMGNNTRITGLRIEGSEKLTTDCCTSEDGYRNAIDIARENWTGTEVDNNEIFGWSGAAVLMDVWNAITPNGGLTTTELGSAILNVHHNYIHDCLSRGYGVGVYRNATALFKGNVLRYVRHGIESDGYPYSGYEATYNVVLGDLNTPGNKLVDFAFDAHGETVSCGILYRVDHNTVFGYGSEHTPFAVGVRGLPLNNFNITFNDFKAYPNYDMVRAKNGNKQIFRILIIGKLQIKEKRGKSK